MSENIVAIIAMLAATLCILIPFYLRHLNNIKKLETLVKLAEGGFDFKTGTVNLFNQESGPLSDLRRGAIFIALSLPIIVSLAIGGFYQEAAIFGGIPLAIGAAYLFVLKFGKRVEPRYESAPQNSGDSF
ncbi:MAG: hypothetical protein Q7W55_06205 [Pseudohongiella sp.]|nr:hypothetical protein [Pseudohongiella sp.]MDO9521605.1 hypothetical protein [Pseudohongiella sp.]MDP2127832.1 hypothetical protein [Pseudohongiella sp.]